MWLTKLREEKGISRQTLAKLSGLSYSYLTKLERGERELTATVRATLEKTLAVRDKNIRKKFYDKPLSELDKDKLKSILKRKDLILEAKLGNAPGTMKIRIEGVLPAEDAMRLINMVRKMLGEL